MSGQPVYGSYGSNMATQQSGSGGSSTWDWLAPFLSFGGSLLGGIGQSQSDSANRNLQAQEFGQTMDLQRNGAMLAAQSMLNRAPLADKGQYLALNQAAPQAFKPRDYTQGLSQVHGTPTGGAQAQVAANQVAANNYRPGAGGVDTSALNLVMSKLGGPQSMATQRTTTVNYGGQQYTPEQWSQYLNQHPEMAARGY